MWVPNLTNSAFERLRMKTGILDDKTVIRVYRRVRQPWEKGGGGRGGRVVKIK